MSVPNTSFSINLANGDSKDMGRKDVLWSRLLLGFSIGIIRPIFHRLEMLSVDIDRFMSLVIYAILSGSQYFSIIGAMLSGPKAVEFLVERIARLISSSVNCMLECGSF